MKITKLIVENFKSFDRVEFSETSQKLGNVNILVGSNASGKSNFRAIFEFFKEIKKSGIEKVVKQKFGGFDKIKNFNTNKDYIFIEIETFRIEKHLNTFDVNYGMDVILQNINYQLTLSQNTDKKLLIQEKISFHTRTELHDLGTNEIFDLHTPYISGIENHEGKFSVFSNGEEVKILKPTETRREFGKMLTEEFVENLNKNYPNKSILEYEGVFIPADIFDFGIYDFEPKLAKGARIDMNTEILDKNGENLSLIIKDILQNQDKEQFIADVKYILDFVENIELESFGNLIDLKVKEKNNKISTESSLLSEGTISMIAMVVALYYQKNDIIFIEEPERCIHPSLIDVLVERFYEVAEEHDNFYNKQVFITTHSPEILKQLQSKEDLYIFLRNENNHSEISRPIDKKLVKDFLENDLDLDTLFVDNLLDN